MHCHTVVLILVSLAAQSLTQVGQPSAPPKIVSEHAQGILSSEKKSQCEQACAQIALKVPAEHLHFSPDEIAYIWTGQQGELTPVCRVQPTSAEEVAAIFGIVKDHDCHFAVKSGGHSQYPGASVADGGVTIDLAKMNKVEVSKDRKSVYVGAGSVWLDVYRTVEAEKLLIVGGRVADVGVGGLLTGGGISFLSNKYGWGCDNILSFEVVLPDGIITLVDQKSHPELFRALKGAGFSNFGIITSFTLEAIVPANTEGFWMDHSLYDTGKTSAFLDEHHALMTGNLVNSDNNAAFLHALVYDPTHGAEMLMTMHYHGAHKSATSYPKIFEYTSKIEKIMDAQTAVVPYSNITTMLYESNPRPGKRTRYICFSHRPSREVNKKMVQFFWEKSVPAVKDIQGILATMVWQPIYRSQRRTKRGGNALGLDDADDILNLVLFPWSWDRPEDDAYMYSKLNEILEAGEAFAKESDVFHPFVYVNYAGANQDVWRGYGEENVKTLKQIQRHYDPEGIYTKGGLASGGFRLNTKDEVLGHGTGSAETEKNVKDEL